MNNKPDLVNFDYELELYDKNYQKDLSGGKKNKELEYIYFFIENNSSKKLLSQNSYSEKYFERLNKWGVDIPIIIQDPSSSYHNWWGSLSDRSFEKRANSKIFSSKVGIDQKWGHPESFASDNLEEIKKRVKECQFSHWVLRNPYGLSGQKSIVLKKEDIILGKADRKIQSIWSDEGLSIVPFLERVVDIGLTFSPMENSAKLLFWNQNIINNKLNFVGAKSGNLDGFDLINLIDQVQEIADYLVREKRFCEIFQIDSFFYTEGKKIKILPLVEINYRKTMGLFFDSLKKIFLEKSSYQNAYFINLKRNQVNFKDDHLVFKERNVKGEAFNLSPFENMYQSFLVLSNDYDSEREILKRYFNSQWY